MPSALLIQYNSISEEIENLQQSEMDKLIAAMARLVIDEESNHENDGTEENLSRQHEKKMLALLCCRILINCGLINVKVTDYKEQIYNDIDTAIKMVQSVKYAWDIDNKVLKDTLDLLSLLFSECPKIIVHYFRKKIFGLNRKKEEISSDLYYLVTSVVRCMNEYGYTDIAATVIEQFSIMSAQRNGTVLHIELISKILPYVADTAPETTYRICQRNSEYFMKDISIVAGDFYWFYACASYSIEKYEEAHVLLEKAYTLRNKVFGNNSWYTAFTKCELVIRSMQSSRDKEVREYLFDFVDNIEQNVYEDMDPDYAMLMEGNVLYVLLSNDPDMESADKYEYYVSLFESICYQDRKYESPILTERMALNIRGAFYFRLGNYMEAEKAFQEALTVESSDLSKSILSDTQIKSNLMMAYYIQNDFEKVMPLLSELLELVDDEESGLSDSDVYRIYNILVSLDSYSDVPDEELKTLIKMMKEECDSISDTNRILEEKDKEEVSLLLSMISMLSQKECLHKKDYQLTYSTLLIIKEHISDLKLEQRRITTLNYILAIVAYELDLPVTDSLMGEATNNLYHNGVPAGIRIAVLQTVSWYYAKQKKINLSKKYLANACQELTDLWHSSVRYLNDTRLMNLLMLTQIQFGGVYAVQRQILSIEESYEYLLKFKAVASLAGRERNRVISKGIIDNELISKIYELQNHIAILEADTALHIDETALCEAKDKLRKLETEFAVRFPNQSSFVDISLEGVMKALPDNSVIIEYIDTVPCFGKRVSEAIEVEEIQCIDMYILKKKNNICELNKRVITKGETTLKKARDFIEIYHALTSDEGASTQQMADLENTRSFLYNELILPVEEELDGIENLYIAPCDELMNVPFGLLNNEKTDLLHTRYNIIKIECARDFLFESNETTAEGRTLIMGDPQYDLQRNLQCLSNQSTQEQRSINLISNSIKPLPFSGVESLKISKQVNGDCYTGVDASKKMLLSAGKYRNIHIATHGWVDYANSADTLYSFCVFLTGAQNWLKDGVVTPQYGNGIVTADEISRQNWKNVNTVVLSTCMSGMNDYAVGKGFHGMVSALSAAGVKYVISSLWNLDDLATAVMMVEFYRRYECEGKQPYEALREAQHYMKKVTIKELKDKGWFDIEDTRVRSVLDRYKLMNERFRPFRNEIYWGGFECFRCN